MRYLILGAHNCSLAGSFARSSEGAARPFSRRPVIRQKSGVGAAMAVPTTGR
jgi:hypothetical protein